MINKINFIPPTENIEELLVAFEKRILQSEKYIKDFRSRHYNKIREDAAIYCLEHAVDLSKGSILAAKANLQDSLDLLSRGVFETALLSRYVTISEENAKDFSESALNEMKRHARKNLEAGYAVASDIRTNENKTKDMLTSELMKNIPKRKNFSEIAQKTGMERVYVQIYGFISISAHGKTIDTKQKNNNIGNIYASTFLSLGCLQAVEIMTLDWIKSRKITSNAILSEIFGMQVDDPK